MAQRTGHITQETRGSRDRDQNISNIRKEIIKKRNEIKKLIYLINTLIPTEQIEEKLYPSKWDYLKRMSKEALEKLQAAKPPFIRPTRSRERVTARSGGECATQQHMKDDCDINIIIKRHAETGNISHLNPKSPLYIDCTRVRDLQGAIHLVEEAEDNFATLPSAVRQACQNDPVKFINMLHTEEGTLELGEAGLEYMLNPDEEKGKETIFPSPKPKTVPAQKIIPGTEPVGDPPPSENPEPPQGGK